MRAPLGMRAHFTLLSFGGEICRDMRSTPLNTAAAESALGGKKTLMLALLKLARGGAMRWLHTHAR